MSESRSGWKEWRTPDGVTHFNITIDEYDVCRWDRERWAMLEDAVFLVKAAFRGETAGPLTLPRTGLPIREDDQPTTYVP